MSLPIPESWFDTKGKMNDEEPATPEELHGLKDYLREATPTSAFKAAKCIMTMNESRIPLTGKDNRVAWLILDAMICFPDRQTALLDLVDAIYKLSDDDVGLNSHLKDKYPQWRKWKSFSRFAELVDEMRRGSYSRKDAAQFLIQCQQAYWAYRYTPEEDDADPKDCFRRWANINALMAHHYVRASEPRGWPTYCLSIIRDGLEQKSSDALMLNVSSSILLFPKDRRRMLISQLKGRSSGISTMATDYWRRSLPSCW